MTEQRELENHLLSNGKPRSHLLSLQESSLALLNAHMLNLIFREPFSSRMQALGFLPLTRSLSCAGAARHFNGGYVAFGSDSKGGSITGQGTVSNERMSIDKVNYLKELDFNLMSVS
ncbi:hypothetical protein L1987_30436 [Smallanthus sonchifolius]|uniref:Uncharacterized protein n=1 Tax=Smallanthus sonchifolius TaxID=185202 RepID=A0ACB9I451_9ASTR|nr:hypothetical protein L1987_30436 [Smallanthus sonchifolius]